MCSCWTSPCRVQAASPSSISSRVSAPVFLSWCSACMPRTNMRVLKAGAAGYLTKESAPDQLITAIQKVARGGKYVSPSLMEKFVSDLGTDMKKPRHEALSDREFQVLCVIAAGKTLTEIAEDLGLSVKTVSTHRTRMLKKLRLRNNADLIHYAIRNKLIS